MENIREYEQKVHRILQDSLKNGGVMRAEDFLAKVDEPAKEDWDQVEAEQEFDQLTEDITQLEDDHQKVIDGKRERREDLCVKVFGDHEYDGETTCMNCGHVFDDLPTHDRYEDLI